MAINEAYNVDCIEYMRTLPDNCFDLAVCDPPYGSGNDPKLGGGKRFGGIFDRYCKLEQTQRRTAREVLQPSETGGAERFGERFRKYFKPEQVSRRNLGDKIPCSNGGGTELEAPTWDIAPPQEFFDELFRVSKNQIIWGGNYFSLPPTRCFLVWKKTNIPQNFSMAMCEYAWTSFKGNAKVFDFTSLRRDNSGKFHPTEKPQELYAWIYKSYVGENQTIFDPMMGSQASRIVAYKMGIDYVGCEIDKYYFDKGCEFFNRECLGIKETEDGKSITQLNLF